MKYIDIERQKKLHKTAKKILNCILEARRRIDGTREHMTHLDSNLSWYLEYYQGRIDILRLAIVRLEQRYAKIISQL